MCVYISSLLSSAAAHIRTGSDGQALLALRLAGVGAAGTDGGVRVANLEFTRSRDPSHVRWPDGMRGLQLAAEAIHPRRAADAYVPIS